MKAFRFYYERVTGGVLAVKRPRPREVLRGKRQAVGGRHRRPNSPPEIVTVNAMYLRKCCVPTSEAKARELHPALFEHPAVLNAWRPWPLVGMWGYRRGGGARYQREPKQRLERGESP
jgi:hypothetical protein